MKKVINGLLFDTDAAIEIAAWHSSVGKTDFSWCEEAVYKTDAGRWFIWGQGGPSTRWATALGNGSFGPGEDLVGMSEVDALRWMENREIDPDIVCEHFTVEVA